MEEKKQFYIYTMHAIHDKNVQKPKYTIQLTEPSINYEKDLAKEVQCHKDQSFNLFQSTYN